jgi:hypothetical protein
MEWKLPVMVRHRSLRFRDKPSISSAQTGTFGFAVPKFADAIES